MSRSIASQFAVAIISALGAIIAADPTIALAQGAMAQGSNAGPPNVSVLPYPDPQFKGVIGRTTADSKPDFPAAGEGARRRAEYAGHPDRRCRLRRLQHVRRTGADADARSARRERPEIQRVQHDRALFADARGADHRARSAHGAYRHHHGAQPRLSRLRFGDAEERGHGRRNSPRQRLQHRLVRQEPQRAGLAEQRRRPVRPVADRARLRLLLRVHRRRHRPVGSDGVREYDSGRTEGEADRRGEGELQSRRRPRGSGDSLDSAAARDCAEQAVLRLLRPRRDARPASRPEGMDREVQGPVRSGLGQAARGNLRAAEEARGHPAGHDPDAAPGQPAGMGLARREAQGTLFPYGGNLRRLSRL